MQKQIVPISFNQGLDTKTDKKQVKGKLLMLKNGFFKSLEEIRKRFGFVELSETPLAKGNALATFKEELIAFNGSKVYSYSDVDDLLYEKGNKIAVSLDVSSIVKNSYNQSTVDSTINANYQLFCYEDSRGGIRYTVKDIESGILIVSDALISSTGFKPKVKSLGVYFVILYGDTSDNNLKIRTISTATPSVISSASNFATDMSGPYPNYDLCLLGSTLYVSYNRSSSIALYSLSATLVQSSQYTVSDDGTWCLTIFADATANNLWIAACSASFEYSYFIVNAALNATTLSPTAIETNTTAGLRITGYADNGVGRVFWEIVDVYSNDVRKADLTVGGTVSAIEYFKLGCGIAGKPFSVNSAYYILLAHGNILGPTDSPFFDNSLQPTYFLLNMSASVVGKLAPGVAGGVLSQNVDLLKNSVPENSIIGLEVYYPYLIKYAVTANAGEFESQLGVSSAKFTFDRGIVTQEISNNLLISGALVSMYDGTNVVESGFNLYPEKPRLQELNGGGALKTGQYQYQTTFEWTDNQGQIHRSAPSEAAEIDINNASTFTKTATRASGFPGLTIADTTGIYPGMVVTGTGIPGNTYVLNIFAPNTVNLTNNASSSGTDTVTFDKSMNFSSFSLTAGSKAVFSSGFVQYLFKPAVLKDNYLMFVDDITLSYLKPGMNVESATNSFTATILSISNNYLILDSTPSVGLLINGLYFFTNGIPTSITSGTDTFVIATNDIPRIKIGDKVDLDSTIKTVTDISGNTVTVDSNFGATGPTTCAVFWNEIAYYYPGHIFTNPNFTGSVTVESVNRRDNSMVVSVAANTTASNQTLSVTNTASVVFTDYNLYLTDKTDARNVIYRTEANGTILYRASSLQNPMINDKNSKTWSLLDTLSDASLVGNDLIYTTGGVIENIAPPASDIFGTFKNRMILIPSENPFSWQYSQQSIQGVPIEFNDSFIATIDQNGGPITAIFDLDEKLLFFKQAFIFYTVGTGPSPTGANNDFIDAQLVATDTGCDERKSIARLPVGLMFKSLKGIYMIDRSLSVNYIGQDVESYNDNIITSAELIKTYNQVRFSINNGTVLVFDYLVGQWSIYEGLSAVDAVIWDNRYTFIQADGKIQKEDETVYTDDGAFVQLYLETSWLQFAGIQGFTRVYKLQLTGEYESPHTLNVISRTDFDETNNQLVQIPVLSDPGVYEYRIFPNIQKCGSMKFIIYDTQEAPFGEGLRLSAMTLQVGVKTGLNKINSGKSYG